MTTTSLVATGPILLSTYARAQQSAAPAIRAAATARGAQAPALAPPGAPLVNPPALSGTNGNYALDIAMRQTNFAGQRVSLRSYVDPNSNASNPPLVGPTITLTGNGQPVQNVSVRLNNRLPIIAEATHAGHGAAAGASNFDAPHGFNTTNLHTHGLHVDPSQDNVYVELSPGLASLPPACLTSPQGGPVVACQGSFTYRYAFGQAPTQTNPAATTKLPAGTYWYHPHKHGSVGVQVASGMAGAFVVTGDLDEIQGVKGLTEQVMVAQMIPVATYAADPSTAVVDPYVFYGINLPNGSTPPQPTTPPNAQISINGQINPTVTIPSGGIQRWRFINATAEQCFYLQVTSPNNSTNVPLLYVIAVDGVPLTNVPASGTNSLSFTVPFLLGVPQPLPLTPPSQMTQAAFDAAVLNEIAYLVPGQRLDLLVQVPQNVAAGNYSVQAVPYAVGQAFGPAAIQNIATIVVSGTQNPAAPLPASSDFNANALYRPPLPSTLPTTLTQNIQFGFVNSGNGAGAVVNNTNSQVPFGPSAPNPPAGAAPFALPTPASQLGLKLGAVDLWRVTSNTTPGIGFGPHAFHIHINSFMMTQRNGYDISSAAIWRDTARIDQGTAPTQQQPNPPEPTVQFVSQQVDYTGDFVLHCHVLEHEDAGMMWSVNISS